MRFALKKPDNIKIRRRIREELGDLPSLAQNITELGQLQPIVIDTQDYLICGFRRLEAIKLAGGAEVQCKIVENADDVLMALTLEEAENTFRKDFTPSEKVKVAQMRAEAMRMANGGKERRKGEVNPDSQTVRLPIEVDPEIPPYSNESKAAAETVGWSPVTFAKAAEVVAKAEEQPEEFGDLKKKMDESGQVGPAHKEMGERLRKKDSLKDKAGVEVPANLRDYFGDMWSRDVSDVFVTTIQSLDNAARRCQSKGPLYQWLRTSQLLVHIKDAINSIELAKETLAAGHTDYVCSNCKGKGFIAGSEQCVDCHGCGWLPEYRYEELVAE